VYVEQSGELVFHALDEPSAEDIEWVARRSFERAKRLLRRRGLLDSDQVDESSADPLGSDQPALAECYSAAVQGLEPPPVHPARPPPQLELDWFDEPA